MDKILLILGVKDLIIWGFDYKHDYDVYTWLWFLTGVLFIILSVVVKSYNTQQRLSAEPTDIKTSDSRKRCKKFRSPFKIVGRLNNKF